MQPSMTTIRGDDSSADVVVLDRRHPSRSASNDAPRSIRVLVADGVRLIRGALRALLEAETDLAVAGEAASGQEVVALVGETHPDVVLMDVELPGLDGVEVIRRIVADPEFSEVNVLIVTASERDDQLLGSLRAGANGFVSRDSEPGELVRAVRRVAAGQTVLSPRVARRVIAELASQPDPWRPSPDELEELTAREREVVALVAAGLSNDEIAQRLVIAPATAKTHVSRALGKLDARDRAQLVTLAYETGLVLPRQHPAAQPAPRAVPTRAAKRTRETSSTTIVAGQPAGVSDETQALVDAERLRIARELHDVVGQLATVNVQARVAAYDADQSPNKAREALRAITAISEEASREMRAILGVLRRTGAADAHPPGHGLAQLDALVATTTGAGLPTRVAVLGHARPLPPALDRAAYSIVQEALTNALRHAGPATASVTLAHEPERLLLDIADDGRGCAASGDAPTPGRGHGITGMRERALALGGELDAGPDPAGGFRVHATLPLEADLSPR
jgi:DNA-binding NarL/FixJ family response regulator/two-component sensor histidine kinase